MPVARVTNTACGVDVVDDQVGDGVLTTADIDAGREAGLARTQVEY